MEQLPTFPFHRDPVASGSLAESDATCDCCGQARGWRYTGVIYSREEPNNLCPWCIHEGKAQEKYDAVFFDANFVDDEGNVVELPLSVHDAVFGRTIGFDTFNPIGWWVHCGEPAEYISRNEPYEMVFECRACAKRHVVLDMD